MTVSSRSDRVFDKPGNVIETHDHGGELKGVVSGSCASGHLRHQNHVFGLLRRGPVAKTSLRNNWGEGHLNIKRQIPTITMVRSAWRRVKKDIKEAIIRDLKPVKDVKGGRRVAGESKPTTGEGTKANTGGHESG